MDPVPWPAGILGALVLLAAWREVNGPRLGLIDLRYAALRSWLGPGLLVGATVGIALLGVQLGFGARAPVRLVLRATSALAFPLLLLGLLTWAGTTL